MFGRHGDDDHHEEDDEDGEIHVALEPLARNPGGPVTAYRVVVINETGASVAFDPDLLAGWEGAQAAGLKYWIAAEIEPSWFQFHKEFVVGDGRVYGGYVNHGPLPSGGAFDFHVTVGAVSELNGVVKATYADVSHEQHARENVVVFRFHQVTAIINCLMPRF